MNSKSSSLKATRLVRTEPGPPRRRSSIASQVVHVSRQVGFAIAALVVAGAIVWWWLEYRSPAPVAWQGYAEADYVKVGPTQQGLLTEVSVARGDQVAAGALLFAQDETADRAARDQALRQLMQAKEQLANLQAGGKQTEIEQALANLADARSTLVRTRADLQRGETLLDAGAISVQAVDQSRADYKSADAKVQALEAALAQSRAPMGRDREILAQATLRRRRKRRSRWPSGGCRSVA
jgi:HlyD family secretion protein